MNPPVLRANALVAQVAADLGFLMATGELPADAEMPCHRVVSVGWCGPLGTSGQFFYCIERGLGEALTVNLLGLRPGEAVSDADLDSSAGELANVLSGNLLPFLYGNDHEFRLLPPQLLPPVDPGGRREAAIEFLEGRLTVATLVSAEASGTLRRAVNLP